VENIPVLSEGLNQKMADNYLPTIFILVITTLTMYLSVNQYADLSTQPTAAPISSRSLARFAFLF
jgi:hypothetical protein